jgi:type I restriction enzyme S subunit
MSLKTEFRVGIARRAVAFGQDCKAIIPNERVDPLYLAYAIRSKADEILGLVDEAGHGTGRLQTEILKELDIPLPPLPEQRAIAQILGSLDDKIELNRQTNESLEAIARALFKSWFVDFDPVRAKAEGRDPGLPPHLADLFPDRFQDSELGEIPAGWRVLGLDEIARFQNGLALQKYPPRDGPSLPVIKIAQLKARDTTGADRASANLDPDHIVDDGDILFSWSGSLECVLWTSGPGALNQHLFKVTSEAFPKWFCYFWIHQHLADFRHIAAGKATTMGHIQRHHLSEARVFAPDPEVLMAADSRIAPILDQIIRNDLESRTLAALRDRLMTKLISGEIRVADLERFAPEAA